MYYFEIDILKKLNFKSYNLINLIKLNYCCFQNGVGWYIWIKKNFRLPDDYQTKPGRILVFEYIITNQCPTLF
jgi:hypothetical protein